jgi:hypothetical protein
MVADSGFSGPLQLHFEYPLGGASDSRGTAVVNRELVYSEMKRDLGRLRGYLVQAKL